MSTPLARNRRRLSDNQCRLLTVAAEHLCLTYYVTNWQSLTA